MTKQEIKDTFEKAGGEFFSSPVALSDKLKRVKALVFDWDGVWHSGRKTGNISSFSEVDSMGLNMLRYCYYLETDHVPITLIITGENNVTAFDYAEREHMDGVFYKAKDKGQALDFIVNRWDLKEEEILFAFDDILDLGIASRVGVKYLINRSGSLLFHDFVKTKGWVDYKTASAGDNNGVRELCELSIGMLDRFEECVEGRMSMSDSYKAYWELRNTMVTQYFTVQENEYTEVSRP